MEDLTYRFKSMGLDLLKCLGRLQWIIIFLSLINLSVSIYEDQIGKFDWHQSYVGRIKFAQFDSVSTAKRIIVATEENVVAALHLKTGQIVWRHVLESSPSGNIELLHVSDKVLVVSGSNPYMVRGWDSTTGVLLWEWSLTVNSEKAKLSKWFVQNGMLVHVLPKLRSHIEVTMYNILTGQNKGSTSKFPAVWTNEECILTPPYYSCISKSSNLLMSLDVTSNAVQVLSTSMDKLTEGRNYDIRPFADDSILPGFLVNEQNPVIIKDNKFVSLKTRFSEEVLSVTVAGLPDEIILMATLKQNETSSILNTFKADTSDSISKKGSHTVSIPEAEITASVCTRGASDQLVCRILVKGADDGTTLLQQEGRVLWTREEALANVVAAEFVDLPVSDQDAAIESEFDQKEGSIWSAFSRRINTQLHQLVTLAQTLSHSWHQEAAANDQQPLELVKDYFNLHKVIVLVTEAGKIFGIDNLSGAVLWHKYFPNLDASRISLFTRRTARYTPFDACVTIVGKHAVTGNGLVISLNPLTGSPVVEGVLQLDVKLLQAAILPRADAEMLHAIMLLDVEENVLVLPLSASRLVENFFMYVAEVDTARVKGYALKYDGRSVNAIKTWSLSLGGDAAGHRLVTAASRPPGERVHSPGRVLGDRSVLYKYLNPNLVLFISETVSDDPSKDIVAATCVDVVSGAVVAAQAHRRARALPRAVLTENYMAYAVHNEKQRRTEIQTLELYEGPRRSDSARSAFSSLRGAGEAGGVLVQRQSYIAAPLAAAAASRTERGITDKHILLALTTGAVVEMSWAFLDPRRPVIPSAEEREEGLIPYAPELPWPAEAVINYNRTVERVRRIHTAPSGLESTSLVLVTGLDLFYTRVAPSRTFDLLKDDFDYFMIAVVLIALITVTYGTKYLSIRKQQKAFWE